MDVSPGSRNTSPEYDVNSEAILLDDEARTGRVPIGISGSKQHPRQLGQVSEIEFASEH